MTDILSDYKTEIAHTLKTAVDEWKAKNPPEKLSKDAVATLERSKDEIIAKLLGFDLDAWHKKDKWKLDHCNGRSGNSTAGDYIANTFRADVNNWLAQADLSDLMLDDDMKESMREKYKDIFKYKFESYVKQHAEAEATRMFDELKLSGELENLQSLDELLGE